VSLRLLALVVPLALDTFAVCAALGAGGLPAAGRQRVAAVLVAFETGMPLIGLLLGRGAADLVGDWVEWGALGCLAAVGFWLLIEGEERVESRPGVAALLLLGLVVSADELAIGFAFGLLGVSIVWALLLIAGQALVAAQLGLRLGARGRRLGQVAERGAGAALVAVAAILLVGRLL
jgi:manganese efflux pump family protein